MAQNGTLKMTESICLTTQSCTSAVSGLLLQCMTWLPLWPRVFLECKVFTVMPVYADRFNPVNCFFDIIQTMLYTSHVGYPIIHFAYDPCELFTFSQRDIEVRIS